MSRDVYVSLFTAWDVYVRQLVHVSKRGSHYLRTRSESNVTYHYVTNMNLEPLSGMDNFGDIINLVIVNAVGNAEGRQASLHVFHPQTDPFALNDHKFRRMFRLTKLLVQRLVEQLTPYKKFYQEVFAGTCGLTIKKTYRPS